MNADRRRPKLQFHVRGQVPVPPGQLGSDYERTVERVAVAYERVAALEFTRLLHRIKRNPVYVSNNGAGLSKLGQHFRTYMYLMQLDRK